MDVEVIVAVRAGGEDFAGMAQNVGVGGIFVATARSRPIGERIEVTFTLPGRDEAVAVDAEVRWMRERGSSENHNRAAGMGLKFLNLPMESRFEIETFLNEGSRSRP
jgi:uncharacterized protein (TIGR02266 family)